MKIYFNVMLVFTLFILVSCTNDGLRKNEKEMIFAAEANVPMRLFTINDKNDSLLLRSVSREVRSSAIGSEGIEHLRKRMLATMLDPSNPGVGIAAPQVGIPVRMIYVQRFDKAGEPCEIYYNPDIIVYGDSINAGPEGCLSIPGFRGTLGRSHNIEITYLDSIGKRQTENINDFAAIIFQHEFDHLNGVLYYDYISGGFGSLIQIEEE